MTKLVLNRDAYGSRGQLSLMADFFELCCQTRAVQVTYKLIADYLTDRKIRVTSHDKVSLNASVPADEDDAEPDAESDHISAADARRIRANEDAGRIVALFKERQRYLGKLYPFELTNNESTLTRHSADLVSYDVALTTALRHSFLEDPTAAYDFERFVAACFVAGRWKVFDLGARVRAAPGAGAARFGAVFKDLIGHLGVLENVHRVVPPRVHDRGADIVTRLPPFDDRPGCRTVLVQVTVGRAGNWMSKASETPRGAWAKLLGDPLEPLIVVALPHHVEREHLFDLVENAHDATVFDRLRLVAHEPVLSAPDFAMATDVYSAGVEW